MRILHKLRIQTRISHRIHVRSIPPAMEAYILPKYFDTYTEVICKYDKNPQCFDDMIVPDIEKQKEILRSFEHFKQTYPMENSPSLQYGIMSLLVLDRPDELDAIRDLLQTQTDAMQLIGQILRSNLP